MIDCIFTLDYEIYGNGTGGLRELVYEPAVRLRDVFEAWNARFVVFVEVGELARIEALRTDPAIIDVKQQVRDLHRDGYEIALHIHPQWWNARYEEGQWLPDYREYNLCTLPPQRIAQIVDSSLRYLRDLVGIPHFTPLAFRAGNWLFQPTRSAAKILAQHGLRVDSSVFKGGVQHIHGLDYRRALRNGYYWRFNHDVTEPEPSGDWLEVPIYTEMVPSWRMLTWKRLAMRNGGGKARTALAYSATRTRDLLRSRYPLKFDFCRMTFKELTSMLAGIIEQDQITPDVYRPIVAIGHTKDIVDYRTVDALLHFLRSARIQVRTFQDIYPKLSADVPDVHRVESVVS